MKGWVVRGTGQPWDVYEWDEIPEPSHEAMNELSIDPATFRSLPEDPSQEADHIYLLRHTLMNPWLPAVVDGKNYVELYWEFLGSQIGCAPRPDAAT